MRKNIISIILATILVTMIFAFDGWRIALGEAPRTYTWQKIWNAHADEGDSNIKVNNSAIESVPCTSLIGMIDYNTFATLCPNTNLEFEKSVNSSD